ncbi:MAG: hypothetical protein JXQ87_13580 [Bacteroidia bacterium]
MSFWRLKREKEIKIRSKRNKEDLLIFLYNYLKSRYDDVRHKDNYIEFEIEPTFHLAPSSGYYGSYTILENNEFTLVKTSLSNPFAKAQNAFIIFTSIFVGIIATLLNFENSSWSYLIVLPLIGGFLYVLNACLFYLSSYFRFQALTKQVMFWADEVIE